MTRIHPGLAAVLLATLGLSLKGIWARLAYQSGFAVADVLFYRALLSLPLVLLGGVLLVRRGETLWAERPRETALGLGLGAFFSVGMYCDFQAIKTVGAGLSRVILFGFPILVMVLDGAFMGKWPSRRSLGGFCLAWVGLWTIALGPERAATSSLWDLRWALSSLVCYAAYVWLSGHLGRKMGAPRLTFLSNLATSACVTLGVATGWGFEFARPSAEPLAWVGVMVLVSTVVPYYLMTEGIVRLGAARASLVSMTGPVVTLVVAALVLEERLSTLQLLGSAGLIAGVVLSRAARPVNRRGVRSRRLECSPG